MDGNSAVHIAAKKGFHQVVEVLAKYDDDVNVPNCKGISPLLIASISGHLEVIVALAPKLTKDDLLKMVQVRSKYFPEKKKYISALGLATGNGHIESAKKLYSLMMKNCGRKEICLFSLVNTYFFIQICLSI